VPSKKNYDPTDDLPERRSVKQTSDLPPINKIDQDGVPSSPL